VTPEGKVNGWIPGTKTTGNPVNYATILGVVKFVMPFSDVYFMNTIRYK
jgi:hypothetical protein